MKPSFNQWLAAVDRHLVRRVGVTTGDLADQCYADWFEDGITPFQAAQLVLQDEGF